MKSISRQYLQSFLHQMAWVAIRKTCHNRSELMPLNYYLHCPALLKKNRCRFDRQHFFDDIIYPDVGLMILAFSYFMRQIVGDIFRS